MIIMGIDPGLATVGYGIVEYSGNKFLGSDYGAIITPPHTPNGERLWQIHDELEKLLKYYKIETAAVEKLYFNTNTTTAIAVAEARGVIQLALTKNKIPYGEYTPLQVKQSVTGYGKAEKNQVMSMVKMLLNLQKIPKPDDAADGLALAICHAHCIGSFAMRGLNLKG